MEESPKRGNSKTVRILVLIVALGAMLALGATTPDARATAFSRLVVSAFTLSLAIALVTTLALIPSPWDPREHRRRVLEGAEREPRDASVTDDPHGGPVHRRSEPYPTEGGDG